MSRILKAILLLICKWKIDNTIFFINFYDFYDITKCDEIFLKYFLTIYYCAIVNNYL